MSVCLRFLHTRILAYSKHSDIERAIPLKGRRGERRGDEPESEVDTEAGRQIDTQTDTDREIRIDKRGERTRMCKMDYFYRMDVICSEQVPVRRRLTKPAMAEISSASISAQFIRC